MNIKVIEKDITTIKITITPTEFRLKYNPKIHKPEDVETARVLGMKELEWYQKANYQYTVRAQCKPYQGTMQLSWDRHCLPEYPRS